MKTVAFGVALASSVFAMNAGGVAYAESLPWQDDSDFKVKVNYNCGPTVYAQGLGFLDSANNGLDAAGLVSVNGTLIGSIAGSVVVTTIGDDSIATYTETVGTLEIEISYRFTNENISRTLVTITNNGAALADLPVTVYNDFGDATFELYHVDGGSWRSSGDWFVTGEYRGYYAEVFHAPDGPGSPESMASVTKCDGSVWGPTASADEYMLFGYQLDIPAGESRRLLIFQGLSNSVDGANAATIKADAIAKATAFGSGSQSPGNGILSDLSAEDACTVVNWVFDGCGSGGGQPSYDIDIDISNYIRESDLPDTL